MRSSGRARPPDAARASAIAAFEAASRGPAARWAPGALDAADGALRDALVEWSRQESPPAAAARLPTRGRPVCRGRDPRARGRAPRRRAPVRGARRRRGGRGRGPLARSARRRARGRHHPAALPARPPAARAPPRARGRDAAPRGRDRRGAGAGGSLARRAARGARPRPRGGGALHLARADRHLAALDRGDARVVAVDGPERDPGPEGEERRSSCSRRARPERTYDAEVGANALGVKRWQGDHATPKGATGS